MRALVVGLVVAAAPSSAAAECAAIGLVPRIATPSSAALPVGGGIVVYSEPTMGASLDPGDAAIQPSWRFRGSAAKPVFVSLAPGLARIEVPPKLAKAELIDGKGASLIAIRTGTARRAQLAAPRPKTASHAVRQARRHYEQVVLELEAAPPATAVAVILLDDRSRPKSFELIPSPTTTLTAYSAGGCTPLPNGTRPTKSGETVRVAFVDDAGRMSAISAPIVVTANTKKP